MNISPNNEKIQKYLDELSNEYKELLFVALLERTKSIDDISISDLLRIDNEIKKPLLTGYQKQQRLRRLIISSGIIYIFSGIGTLLFYEIIENGFYSDRIIPLMSFIIILVGICFLSMSFILPTNKTFPYRSSESSKSEKRNLLAYNVITQWRELEGIVNDLAENNNVSTPRSIIDYLLSNKIIDKEEGDTLKEFLKIRNSIVHLSEEMYSTDEIKEASSRVSMIIEKLNKIL